MSGILPRPLPFSEFVYWAERYVEEQDQEFAIHCLDVLDSEYVGFHGRKLSEEAERRKQGKGKKEDRINLNHVPGYATAFGGPGGAKKKVQEEKKK